MARQTVKLSVKMSEGFQVIRVWQIVIKVLKIDRDGVLFDVDGQDVRIELVSE